MEVRFGNAADIDQWINLVRRVSWNFPGLETEKDLEEHRQTVLKFIEKRQALCVEADDQIQGVLLFSRNRNMICCLAVSPESRRNGIASKLLQTALSELDRNRDITVSTFREGDEKGVAPRSLYKKFGFVEAELTEEFGYPNQVFVLHKDTIQMTKEEKAKRETVERWGCFELSVAGKQDGNPFTDYTIHGQFRGEHETVSADGFYDGDGIYKIRFMPSFSGIYHYEIDGTFGMPQSGTIEVTEAAEGNHGPVRVTDTFYFSYADGTPFYPLGTTCYVWELQTNELIRQTLESLKKARFNKIRFCILPKHYDYNLGEPRSYPFEGTPMDSSVLTKDNFDQYTGKTEGNHFDFSRPNPAHFRHIEHCILELQKLGIEADLIVMHPYDRWGFSSMPREADELYWRYVIARFSAYRNVWWAAANEYDLLRDKKEADWEFYGQLMVKHDPYHHLRSIHNCISFYDHTRPWITHCSIQRQDLYRTTEYTDQWREQYHKPVVLDEIAYEGNIQHGWGNITGEELIRRFWEGALRGGYPGHGETFLHPKDILWWSHGGELHGESWKRVGFLLDVLNGVPGNGLRPAEKNFMEWDCVHAIPAQAETTADSCYHLYYFSFMRPSFREFSLPENHEWKVEVIDTWNMTITETGVFRGKCRVDTGGKQFMAVRITRQK